MGWTLIASESIKVQILTMKTRNEPTLFDVPELPQRDTDGDFRTALGALFETYPGIRHDIESEAEFADSWVVCESWRRFIPATRGAVGIHCSVHYNAAVGETIEDDELGFDYTPPIFGFWRDGESPVIYQGLDLCKRIIAWVKLFRREP